MQLKKIIPDMEKTFGKLEFASVGDVETRRANGRTSIVNRTYHLYSSVQLGDDVIVVCPGQIGTKGFEMEEEIHLVNPEIIAENRSGGDRNRVNYVLHADDILTSEQMREYLKAQNGNK